MNLVRSFLHLHKVIKEKIENIRGNGTSSAELGVEYFRLGRYQNAIEAFSKAIKANPKDVEAYNNRGTAYLKLGNCHEAINDFSDAITINPKFVEAYYERGVANDILGNKLLAIKDFDKAIELDPTHLNAFFHRGQTYYGLDDYHQSIRDNDKVIELDPNFAAGYFERGIASSELGYLEEAIDDFNTAIKLKSKYTEARLKLKEIKSKLSIKDSVTKRAMQSAADLEKNAIVNKAAYERIVLAHDNFKQYLQKVQESMQAEEKRKRRPIPEKVKQYVWRRDQGQCVKCGSRERLEFDHIIPHSRGGSDTERNIELLCEKCNRTKHAKI